MTNHDDPSTLPPTAGRPPAAGPSPEQPSAGPPPAAGPSPEQPSAGPSPGHEGGGYSPFPIVGIGASAGGLEAFTQLLENLPTHTGMAFILVQHLDPRHASHLRDLLGRTTEIPVLEVEHGMKVEPDKVYVIPPNVDLTIDQGRLLMTPRADTRAPHLAIDHFFRSLAAEQRSRAIGVLLSGSGSDGTSGIAEIKAVGGITLAQNEASARHDSMPRSAIESGGVDFVLPPDQIARRLAEIGGHPYMADSGDRPVEKGDGFRRVLTALRTVTGVDFTKYRDSTIRRRIQRRMALHGLRSLDDYAEHLQGDTPEVEALYRDVLITVTSFFRDPELFEVLKRRVFPEIVEGKSPKQPVRVWVPGCSTGQEAYSIAMALIEHFDDKPSRPDLQIFATDLSDDATLDKARSGVYPETIQAEVTPERLRRFFRKEDHVYRINKMIRDLCIFARQNVAADPPFSRIDLISCRNVLIYMSPALQKHVLPMFHYALESHGFLVLGSSESAGQSDLFDLVDRAHRIYRKRQLANRPPLVFSTPSHAMTGARSDPQGSAEVTAADFSREADRLLVGRYVPPGVLITGDYEILQFRGDTGAFLQTPAGDPTTNLMRMAREGLFLALRGAVEEAKKTSRPVTRTGVTITDRSGARETSLQVIPVRPPRAASCCYLIVFEPDGTAASAPASAPAPGTPATREADHGAADVSDAEHELLRLRHEFAATSEYLQSVSEQQDAANEELRAANEEILSSNEELQSTNEELQTAKEELQSANEELTTVNEQLQHRNLELNVLSNDLSNVLSSTGIPLVMVGSDLRVRRLTPAARRILNLLPTDVGRPIGEIRSSLTLSSLDTLVAQVIDEVRPVEQEVRDNDGAWWLLRILPYRTADNRIDGAVVYLVDVDALKTTEEKWREALDYSSAILETTHEPLIVLDQELRVVSANRAFNEKFDLDPGLIDGLGVGEELNRRWSIPSVVELLERVRREHRNVDDLAVQHEFPGLGWRSLLLSARIIERGESPYLILLALEDTTERQRRIEARAAVEARDRFLAMMSHEMRNPLAAMDGAARVLRLHAGEETPAAASARGSLERQLAHLIRLVDDFLDLSRLDHDKIQLRRRPVDIEHALRTAVAAVGPRVEAKSHTIRIVPPKEPLQVDADPLRLEQILVNLLTNAIKFSPEGAKIELAAEAAGARAARAGESKRSEVLIRVRDRGVGISPELLPRIFDDFAQGHDASDQGGLGLGLSLVRRLVGRHGGTIEAQSDGVGRGTEIRLRLPQADGAATAADDDDSDLRPAPSAAPVGRRLLLVEDNHDAAQVLAILLERIGHQVRIAHDGPAALAAIREAPPEFALVDVGLPGMTGYELAREIRKLPEGQDVALIAHTGYAQESDRERARTAGFAHHLVKPLDWKALERLLNGEGSQGKDAS